MKARDTLTTGTLRLALAAVTTAEVSGTQAKELSDAEVVAVLQKEVRKRGEAAEAFAGAGRAEQAAKERAEADVLSAYLPRALTDDEVDRPGAAGRRIGGGEHRFAAPTMRQMGLVIKDVQARGRAGRTVPGSPPRSSSRCPVRAERTP